MSFGNTDIYSDTSFFYGLLRKYFRFCRCVCHTFLHFCFCFSSLQRIELLLIAGEVQWNYRVVENLLILPIFRIWTVTIILALWHRRFHNDTSKVWSLWYAEFRQIQQLVRTVAGHVTKPDPAIQRPVGLAYDRLYGPRAEPDEESTPEQHVYVLLVFRAVQFWIP